MATIPITKRGAEKLKAELHKLKTVDRPWVIGAIAEARAQGDLSENAEYEAAKDRWSWKTRPLAMWSSTRSWVKMRRT